MELPVGSAGPLYFEAIDEFTGELLSDLSDFTVHTSRAGGAAAELVSPTIAFVRPGVYVLTLPSSLAVLDSGWDRQSLVVQILHLGMQTWQGEVIIYRHKITVGNTLTVESDGDLTKVNTLDGHIPQTGDSFARIGAPTGASVSADIAAKAQQNTLLALSVIVEDIDDGVEFLDQEFDEMREAYTDALAMQLGIATNGLTGPGTATGLPTTSDVGNATDVAAVKTVTDKLDAMIDDTGSPIFTEAALAEAPTGTGQPISPREVTPGHTWNFTAIDQLMGRAVIQEYVGFNGVVELNLDNMLSEQVSIYSASLATVSPVTGLTVTEPLTVTPNKRGVHLICNATVAGTYTITVTIETTDSQIFTRKGQLIIK